MILDDIKEELPKDANITDVSYEGSEIILYTGNRDFFRTCTPEIKKIVSKVKKRIEVRADPSLITNEEDTEDFIRKTVPKDAVIKDIYFEPEFAKVVIHAEKPGLVIGKSGETLGLIKEKTFWTPDIKRAPVIDSEIIRSIRKMLHNEAGYRKKFLNKLGEKIYSESKEIEWIRVTALGGFREVGRSCILLQTPQSRVLMDCGFATGSNLSKPFPYLDVSEFNIQSLDSVVLSHAHSDHCLPPHALVTMSDGSLKPISEIVEGDEVMSMNFQDARIEAGKCVGKTSTKGHKKILRLKTPFRTIESSPNHRFFIVRNLEIVETQADGLQDGNLLPVTSVKDKSIRPSVTLNTDIEYDKRRKDITYLSKTADEKLASLIGYMQGDGHYGSKTTIRITDGDINLLEFYGNLVYEIFNYKPIIRHHSDSTKNAWILEINNVKILRFLEGNFPNFLAKTKERQIPKKITESDVTVKLGYMRGLMDAEGSVSLKAPNIRFASYSKDLLSQIKELMNVSGISCRLDEKNHSIHIASLHNIRTFANLVGFNSIKKRDKMNILSNKEGLLEKDIVPIVSKDLFRVIKEAGLFGRVHNSPAFSRNNLGLYDWLRRGGSSYCTKRTARNLVRILESRVAELNGMKKDLQENKLKTVRQGLSLSLSTLESETGIPYYVLQNREEGYVDHIYDILSIVLNEKLIQAISITAENIQKIKNILEIPVVWEQITDIECLENPYHELIDIEVSPHKNFITGGIVVHNSGVIPFLYEFGFRGPLYCTRPTRDLAALLQLDYIQICHRENRKPFYTSKGIEEMIKHCITLDYGEVSDIAPDMRLTLQNAGHLLGSSVVHIHIGDGLYNLLYTGDVKFEPTRMFEPTSNDFTRVEAVIIESTYGNEDSHHQPRNEAERILIESIKKCLERGGKAIIPTFAVGRGQDVISILTESDIDTTMYLDGMVWDATAIHTAYPEFMSRYMQTRILHRSKNPFLDPRLKGIGSQKERLQVLESSEPCIILTTSGMLQGGPIMQYLRELSAEPKNMLIFVGYQAEGTPGRRIQKGWKQIQFDDGKAIELNLEIVTIEGLSGHSDFRELVNYISTLSNKPKKIMVNHGDPLRCVSLARAVHKIFKVETLAPKNLETIRLR
ncbi:MAG: MBL fold metallo-hydrolase [Candidatus Aenigmarchaeota archaeon]|nr:MBL fold metallo-hydrolase [Candidatus Aenigmarchaeota archaeon]